MAKQRKECPEAWVQIQDKIQILLRHPSFQTVPGQYYRFCNGILPSRLFQVNFAAASFLLNCSRSILQILLRHPSFQTVPSQYVRFCCNILLSRLFHVNIVYFIATSFLSDCYKSILYILLQHPSFQTVPSQYCIMFIGSKCALVLSFVSINIIQ